MYSNVYGEWFSHIRHIEPTANGWKITGLATCTLTVVDPGCIYTRFGFKSTSMRSIMNQAYEKKEMNWLVDMDR